MGFNDAVRELIAALDEDRFEASVRGSKNWLASGARGAQQVIAMLRRCDQSEYVEDFLHDDPSTVVHIFKPLYKRRRWYIKAYFVEQDEQVAIVISVHPSEP